MDDEYFKNLTPDSSIVVPGNLIPESLIVIPGSLIPDSSMMIPGNRRPHDAFCLFLIFLTI